MIDDESWCTIFHMETGFACMKSNSFPFERLCTKTRFKAEVKGDSELAFC